MMQVPTLFCTFVLLLMTSNAIEEVPHLIHLLRPHSGSSGHHVPGLNCLSWRLGVETDNIRDWKVVPEQCEGYVGHYMLGRQYRDDSNAVAEAAYEYAKGLELAKDGKDIWVFDIDETSLSNLPYYARPDIAFGAKKYNSTAFNEWQAQAKAPALPATFNLYKNLLQLGFKIVFLSGTTEPYRKPKELNMKKIGYHTWERMILKQTYESRMTAVEYKSKNRKELEMMGYRILGNMGDQWSDLLGAHVGNRTFKLPDPMYYIS